MDKKSLAIKRLTELTDDEWKVALEKCRRLIDYRVQGRTKFGCHSEQQLGMLPFDYYVKEAIDKLYDGSWEWNYEKYSFPEQMCRIIGSLISENVRKYRVKQEREGEKAKAHVPFDDIANCLGVDFGECSSLEEKEKKYEDQLNIVLQAIDGNDDMESLFFLIMDGKSSDEICKERGWERKKLYRVTDRMKTKVKKFNAKRSKEIVK